MSVPKPPTRFPPLTPVKINEVCYRDGHWVARKEDIYIQATERSFTQVQLDEKRSGQQSCLATHLNIINGLNSQREPITQRDDQVEARGGYCALILPHLAYVSPKGCFYNTRSQFHHFTLYYMPICDDISRKLNKILKALTIRLEAFFYHSKWRSVERCYAWAYEVLPRYPVWDDNERREREEMGIWLTEEQMDGIAENNPDCVPLHKPDQTVKGRLRYLKIRDQARLRRKKACEAAWETDKRTKRLNATSGVLDDDYLHVVFEGGIVGGEAKVLLNYLHDCLVFELSAWYANPEQIKETVLLDGASWHISMQDEGAAYCSHTLTE